MTQPDTSFGEFVPLSRELAGAAEAAEYTDCTYAER